MSRALGSRWVSRWQQVRENFRSGEVLPVFLPSFSFGEVDTPGLVEARGRGRDARNYFTGEVAIACKGPGLGVGNKGGTFVYDLGAQKERVGDITIHQLRKREPGGRVMHKASKAARCDRLDAWAFA